MTLFRSRRRVDPESKAERDHAKKARARGWFVDKILRTSRNSFPDRFYANGTRRQTCSLCNRGRVVLMEWKAEGQKLRKQQELRIGELRQAGIEVHVVSSVAEANRILGIADEPAEDMQEFEL